MALFFATEESGALIVFGSRNLRGFTMDKDLRLQRVLVKATQKAKIRGELERLGIHAGALFPEIDKAAEFIVKRYAVKQF